MNRPPGDAPIPLPAANPQAVPPPPDGVRRRGAQLRNQNARKLSIYSPHLQPEEAGRIQDLLKVIGLADEIAILRLRIGDLVGRNAPHETLFEALDLLNRLVSTHDRVTSIHW